MMNDELKRKVLEGLKKTGYPLELEIAAIARRNKWIVFHGNEYDDPFTGKFRELDLLIYKKIKQRRVELRISCKSSESKQFIFFAEDRTGYIPMGDLKCTPLQGDPEWSRSIREALISLPLFSYPERAINYTVMSGADVDREARSLLRDAIMSAVNSVHFSLLPGRLLLDPRGTAYFFVVILRGNMFKASFEETRQEMVLDDTDYALWHGKIPIPDNYWALTIKDVDGKPVKFGHAMYWFHDSLHVELIKETSFESYLKGIESAFEKLTEDELKLFGKPWTPENFPKTVGPAPTLSTRKKNALEDKSE